jgi:16S rRNA (cytosine967-C5)-methyltransferase
MAQQGLAMLTALASHIEPGGFIIYASCSVLREENEQVIEAFLGSDAGTTFSTASYEPAPAEGRERDFASAGQAVFCSALSPGSPDAHFAVKLVRD